MKKLFLLLPALIILSATSPIQAASISLDPTYYLENNQKFYEVGVYLNSNEENINALEGELAYSVKDLVFQKTINGGSIVNLWLKDPRIESDGKIVFSGGIPGGFKGEKGLVFSAIFKSGDNLSSGQTTVSTRNFKAYLNNSTGTEITITNASNTFSLNELDQVQKQEDTKPPEVFAPYVTRDPNLYGDLWILVFYAQDKGEGIDHYAVFESPERYNPETINDSDSRWKTAGTGKSYILNDQSLKSYIYVKAVDKSGNSKTAIVVPVDSQKTGFYNLKLSLLFAIIVIIGVLAVLKFLLRGKYKKFHK